MSDRRVRQITPSEAKRTIASRLAPVVDRVRQVVVRVGLRPYNVFLVWTRWGGIVRGKGEESVIVREPLTPTPKLDLTGLERASGAAGYVETGTATLAKVSTTYTSDELSGLLSDRLRELHKVEQVPEPLDFYYEVVEDGRGDVPPARRRFRLSAAPSRASFTWTVKLERMNQDATRDGKPATEPTPPAKAFQGLDGEEDV